MLTVKPQDPPVTDQLEQSTDGVYRREGKLAGAWIIGTSVAAVGLLDIVRQRLLPGTDIWLFALVFPVWFVICLFGPRRRG